MEGQVRIMMNALTHMSDIMIPMVIFWIVGYGMVSGVKVYETFLKGAKEGHDFLLFHLRLF